MNVILIAHDAPAATLEPHADVSNEYGPLVTNGGTGNGPVARLVSVRVLEVE